MNIYEKLAAIQQELKAPKDKYNSFGEYHYRSAEGILEAVKPLLAANKATIVISDEIVAVGDRTFVKATANFVDIETDGNTGAVTAFAELTKEKKKLDASQLTGVASSYARKYALNGLLLIDDTKDPDTDEYAKQTGSDQNTNGPAEQSKATKVQLMAINDLCEKAKITLDKVLKKPVEELTPDEATKLIIALKKKAGE